MSKEASVQAQRAASDPECPEVLQERVWGDAGERMAMANFSQKMIEQKEREIQESITSNYSKIKQVEKELSNLQQQLKMTAGPKKKALELIRKKIEIQTEVVTTARNKHAAAKVVADKLEAALVVEEQVKERLCDELNTLVQQSVQAQLDKFEELKTQLDSLGSNRTASAPAPASLRSAAPASSSANSGSSSSAPGPVLPLSTPAQAPSPSGADAAQSSEADKAAAAAAAAARARHVGLAIGRGPKAGGAARPNSAGAVRGGGSGSGSSGALRQPEALPGKFTGFDA